MNYFVTSTIALMLMIPAALFAQTTRSGINWEDGGGKIEAKKSGGKPATEDSELPRVLLIGDSISIGYTPVVQQLLKGKAEVIHPPGNCMDSGHGVKSVKTWVTAGGKKWDVIHFNFGIWDTHYLDKKSGALLRDESKVSLDDVRIRATPEQYRENLKKVITELKATGAKLIFATTTPVMYRKGARFEDIVKLNEVAVALMKEEGIEVNDLYSASLASADKWIGSDRVHMAPAGSAALGEMVSQKVLAAMGATTQPAPK